MGKESSRLLEVRGSMVAGQVFQATAFPCNQSRSSDLCGFAVNLSLSPSCNGHRALQSIDNRQSLVFPFIKI